MKIIKTICEVKSRDRWETVQSGLLVRPGQRGRGVGGADGAQNHVSQGEQVAVEDGGTLLLCGCYPALTITGCVRSKFMHKK